MLENRLKASLVPFAFAQIVACGPSGVIILRLDGSIGEEAPFMIDAGRESPASEDAAVRTDAGEPPRDVGFLGEDARSPLDALGESDAAIARDAAAPSDAGLRSDAGRPPPSGSAYPNASETVHQLRPVLELTGSYGVVLAGGHLVASDARGGTGFPRETPLSSSDTIVIPEGATVRHALLWYSGPIFMKPAANGQGDYTSDIGGALDDAEDIAANGITFSLNGTRHGPFDPSMRRPPSPSSVGSESQLSPHTLDFTFGTFTGVRETVWSNRLDVTSLFSGSSGTVNVTVSPPEKLDVNGNNASNNGGNPAGQTTYNMCSGAASWSLLVIYEKSDLPRRNLVLEDGTWARAWDYIFFHTGEWQRPKIRIDHAPIRSGAKFYTYVASGQPAGSSLPGSPTCSCGCGGQYTLRNQSGGYGLNAYFSNTHLDPAQTMSDPIHRDRTNGPWYLHPGDLGRSITGNDWTLFQSGEVYTEIPNLYEGDRAPAADTTQPLTNEDDPRAGRDTYGGHPWNGRAQVRYHATGNALTVVEVELDPSRITPGETSSFVYLKGDQKDVWKPQHIISMKWLLFETPVE
jgi:hypothetical protein